MVWAVRAENFILTAILSLSSIRQIALTEVIHQTPLILFRMIVRQWLEEGIIWLQIRILQMVEPMYWNIQQSH